MPRGPEAQPPLSATTVPRLPAAPALEELVGGAHLSCSPMRPPTWLAGWLGKGLEEAPAKCQHLSKAPQGHLPSSAGVGHQQLLSPGLGSLLPNSLWASAGHCGGGGDTEDAGWDMAPP